MEIDAEKSINLNWSIAIKTIEKQFYIWHGNVTNGLKAKYSLIILRLFQHY